MKSDEETWQAIIDPQPGDLFTEMYSFWLHVVDRDKYNVKTLVAHGGNTVPPDGKVAEVPLDIFILRFSYGAHLPEKSWVTLVERGKDFSMFNDEWDVFVKDDGYDKYINPIHKNHPFVSRTVQQILRSKTLEEIITEMVTQSLLKMKLKEE